MSHNITVSLELKEAQCMRLDDSISDIRECIEKCIEMSESYSDVIDSELSVMIRSTIEECEASIRTLQALKTDMLNISDFSEMDRLMHEASMQNAVFLKADALTEALLNSLHEHYQNPELSFRKRLESINDVQTKLLVQLLHSNPANSGLDFDELMSLAESKLHPDRKASGNHTVSLKEQLMKRMSAEKIDPGTAESALGGDDPRSPLEMYNAAQTLIADERKRRAAINAVIRSISERGFIVKKSNVRHFREDDTVRFTASKPGGQKAEFIIDISGRFTYHFDGYDGLACEKDITPLENDLEKVYGFKLNDRNVTWSNPDKTMKQHHMAMKVKRDS